MKVELLPSQRYSSTKFFSVRLDVRHHMFLRDTPFSGGGLDHELWIALAFGLGA